MSAARTIPCRHQKREPGCQWCRLADSDPRYAALFASRPDARPAPPCHRLGAPTGETVACPTCTGRVQLKTFACDLHGRCTLGKAAPGVACCSTCPDHTSRNPAKPEPMPEGHRFTVRDCLYHVYPLPGEAGQVWRQRLGVLVRRAKLFNGTRLVACMTGPGLEPPSEVRRLAGPAGFDVAELENDPSLREAKTLLRLLERCRGGGTERALFFGHAKGVTREPAKGNTCHPWAMICHETCLDYWPLVEQLLGRFPIVGPFKKVGHAFSGSKSAWHFSGSFFWVRSADLFGRRPWQDVERKWFGVESTPGIWYAPGEAGAIFHEAPAEAMNLYDPAYFKETLASYLWWRSANDHLRTPAEYVS